MIDSINDNNTEITHSSEFKEKLKDLKSPKSELVKLILERDTFKNTVKRSLEALYTIKIGKNEFPFTIEQVIDDENWIADKNSEIFKKIEKPNNKKEKLQLAADGFLLQSIDSPDPGTVKLELIITSSIRSGSIVKILLDSYIN